MRACCRFQGHPIPVEQGDCGTVQPLRADAAVEQPVDLLLQCHVSAPLKLYVVTRSARKRLSRAHQILARHAFGRTEGRGDGFISQNEIKHAAKEGRIRYLLARHVRGKPCLLQECKDHSFIGSDVGNGCNCNLLRCLLSHVALTNDSRVMGQDCLAIAEKLLSGASMGKRMFPKWETVATVGSIVAEGRQRYL